MSYSASLAPVPGQPTWADVQAAYEAGKRQAGTAAGVKSFERVYEAMLALRDRREAVGFKSVALVCRNRFGSPSEGGIRNNRPLADLVRIAIASEMSRVRVRVGRPIEEEILEQIGDQRIRAEAEGILADRRALRTEVDGLRKAFHTMDPIARCSREMVAAGAKTLSELAEKAAAARIVDSGAGVQFTEQHRAACRAFLEEGLASLNLEIHEKSGKVIDKRSLRTVAPAGLASALRLVAGSASAS